jgi:hypothetical protein
VKPYLVLARPRSGSAWLSNFLTSGDCICVHEPLAYSPTLDGYRVVGGVDTGGALFLDEIKERLPGVRLYSLVRDPKEVRKSLKALDLPDIEFPILDLPTFEYARLFDVGYLAGVWEELCGPGFDPVRAEMLIEMNIQRDLKRLVGKIKEQV